MNELEKIRRVAGRAAEGAPHEVLLVLDATVGQNGLQQAKEFTQVAGVTGIVLTKLDGTAKGGVAVAIAHDLKLPIQYVGRRRGDRRPDSVFPGRLRGRAVPGQVVDDVRWMRRAIEHARRGLGRTAPNPLVGACVVSDDGVVLGQGAHERAGEPHAEIHALDEAGARARGATLYCTLEPCAHTGRTGPCTERVIAAGIRRVVAAMEDPFPLVRGRGFAALRASGIEVDVGIEHDAAVRLNQPYLNVAADRAAVRHPQGGDQPRRPHRGGAGRRTQLTSLPALRHAHCVRAQVDAVAVGSDTVLVGRSAADGARGLPRAPAHARRLRSAAARAARRAGLLDAGAGAGHRADVVATRCRQAARGSRRSERPAPRCSGPSATNAVAASSSWVRSACRAWCSKAAPRCTRAAWDEGVVDAVQLYVAPVVLGGGGVPLLDGRGFSSTALVERRVDLLGPDVLIEGYVHRPH